MTMSEIDNVSEQIAAVRQEITDLGDVQSIHASISELNASVADLRTTLDLTNSNITTLQEFKTAVSDYVVQSQTPTSSNNYTWYRKYKSGWVEQGGKITLSGTISATNVRVTFPVERGYGMFCRVGINNGNINRYDNVKKWYDNMVRVRHGEKIKIRVGKSPTLFS